MAAGISGFALENDAMAKGGGADGSISGQFHGGGGDDNDQPAALVGEFNAYFVNGAVAGAFGASKQP